MELTLVLKCCLTVARWVTDGWPAIDEVGRIFSALTVKDYWGRPVLLFKNSWNVSQLEGDHPDLKLTNIAPVASGLQPASM